MITKNFDDKKTMWEMTVSGEVELTNAETVKQELLECLKTGSVVIDFAELTYIDSTGLGMLVGADRIAKMSEKKLIIKGVRPHIMKIFELTNLDKLFEMER